MKKLCFLLIGAGVLMGCNQPTGSDGNGGANNSFPEVLVGQWGVGETVMMRIKADKTGWLNKESLTGTWTAEGNTLTFTAEGKTGQATYFSYGDTLELSQSRGELKDSFESLTGKSLKKISTPGQGDPDPQTKFLVVFKANYEGANPPVLSSVDIMSGGKITRPSVDPARSGYSFIGWFSEALGYIPYDFDKTVTANTTLYARWDNPTAAGSAPHDLDAIFATILDLTDVSPKYKGPQNGSEYTGYARYYRRSDGSLIVVSEMYDIGDKLYSRTMGYTKMLTAENPVIMKLGTETYTFKKRASFSINLISTPPTNTFEVSGSGKIILKSTRFATYPMLDRKTFVGGDGELESFIFIPKKVYDDELPVMADSLGIRQIEITSYSPDVLTVEGFLAGTYYFCSDKPIHIPYPVE
jgi:uncharacterized repeat protein (TIGR02543 family)